jgi:hypothetical protein
MADFTYLAFTLASFFALRMALPAASTPLETFFLVGAAFLTGIGLAALTTVALSYLGAAGRDFFSLASAFLMVFFSFLIGT